MRPAQPKLIILNAMLMKPALTIGSFWRYFKAMSTEVAPWMIDVTRNAFVLASKDSGIDSKPLVAPVERICIVEAK